MDVGPAFVADPQAAELMKPTDCAFDDPTELSKAAAVWRAALGDARFNAFAPQENAVHFGVVCAVGIEALRTLNRTARFASNRRDGVHQPDQLSHVVPVCSCQLAR